MSVINTNITSMIAQQNLNDSKGALETNMERLSSGLRINSAKDDAAGQAIANRFEAQTTGLAQAQRNANDGISVAQTAEGALDQINDNVQRVRELTVQAENGTNSDKDLTSIQDEIGQRLEEIDRISQQTDFNGTKVLDEGADKLSIQVGANDNETISVNLEQVNSETLGLGTFNVNGLEASEFSSALNGAGEGTTNESVTVKNNAATPPSSGPEGPSPSGITAEDVYNKSGSGFAVKASDGNFYDLSENSTTGDYTWDSSSTAVSESNVKIAAGPAEAKIDSISTPSLSFETSSQTNSDGEIFVDNDNGDFSSTTEVYERNDKVGNDGLAEYAVKGDDGNYYAVDTIRDVGAGEVSFSLDNDGLTQISEDNVNTTAASDIEMSREAPPSAGDDLLNEDMTIPTATDSDLYALKDSDGYAVKASNDNYYAATLDGGEVSWDSSDGNIDAETVDVTAGNVTDVDTTVTGQYTGDLNTSAGETLHSYEDADGETAYAVKSGSGDDVTFTKATLGDPDTTTGDIAVTKETGDDAELSIRSEDPLEGLDKALNDIDSMRSDLGAIQNRFESAITNLSTNETNLSDAQSRIEDADYASEVAAMTKNQILQQAGTSVLAQANQLPQNALSLLG